ncbi:MAG: hypothetical protein KIS81_09035 [Maricaulaceae bacterium]|nr:hypothetical protein [Maricaulaceae bacterium]
MTEEPTQITPMMALLLSEAMPAIIALASASVGATLAYFGSLHLQKIKERKEIRSGALAINYKTIDVINNIKSISMYINNSINEQERVNDSSLWSIFEPLLGIRSYDRELTPREIAALDHVELEELKFTLVQAFSLENSLVIAVHNFNKIKMHSRPMIAKLSTFTEDGEAHLNINRNEHKIEYSYILQMNSIAQQFIKLSREADVFVDSLLSIYNEAIENDPMKWGIKNRIETRSQERNPDGV